MSREGEFTGLTVATKGCLTWIRLRQPQKQRYPFLPVCAIFSCVQAMVKLPLFRIFNVRTDVDACNCTRAVGVRLQLTEDDWDVGSDYS